MKANKIELWQYTSIPKVKNEQCPKCSSTDIELPGTSYENKEKVAFLHCKKCDNEWKKLAKDVEVA